MEVVKKYLENDLSSFLRAQGISNSFIRHIQDVIELQIISCLRHWDDLAFRKTLLLLGSEEGPFYKPMGKYEVMCFVVVTIRNSPLETVQSDSCQSAGLRSPLPSKGIQQITSRAVQYFNTQNIPLLCEEAKKSSLPDIYGDAARRYPVSWAALQQAANSKSCASNYTSIPVCEPYNFEGWLLHNISEKSSSKADRLVVLDAYSPDFEPPIINFLQDVVSTPQAAFIVDSFKTATRNFEKLLKIIEFLLTRGHAFSTCNYYLENGHVERRSKPIRAAHTTSEMKHNFSQLSGLQYKHAAALRKHLTQFV